MYFVIQNRKGNHNLSSSSETGDLTSSCVNSSHKLDLLDMLVEDLLAE